MAETVQSFKNHGRMDPWYHIVLGFLLLITLVHSVMLVVHRNDVLAWTMLTMILALTITAIKVRSYSLKVQDRVIRLEERLRLMTILPPLLHHKIAELSVPQLVALRFASDKELMALVARTLEEKLEPKEIKAAIVDWRADNFRV